MRGSLYCDPKQYAWQPILRPEAVCVAAYTATEAVCVAAYTATAAAGFVTVPACFVRTSFVNA